MSEPFIDVQSGDNIALMRDLPENFIDAVVTDPPYGIGFMGKEWDTFKPGVESKRIVENRAAESDNPNLKGRSRGPASSPSAVEYDRSLLGQRAFQTWTEEWAREAYRVLKPGAHMLVFGAPRAHHRMMSGLEDAGFEIRDCLAWMFGQGFPKSLNLKGEWEGWGTALKPAFEPIALARKPFKGSLTKNVETWSVGALNIDGCRVGYASDADKISARPASMPAASDSIGTFATRDRRGEAPEDFQSDKGRWPAGVLLDEAAAAMLDAQSGITKSGAMKREVPAYDGESVTGFLRGRSGPSNQHGDSGGASRFFYCPKVSRAEREFGCDHLPARSAGEMTGGREEGSAGLDNPRAGAGRTSGSHNAHPTVKPIALMRWLVRLVTPPDGIVLDPFVGSGSTGIAAALEGFNFIGMEREQEWVTVAETRIAAWMARQLADAA